jgi:hypothetical protein
MSNASRCLHTAAHYAELAEGAADSELMRVYRRLEQLWRDMAPLAADFDRRSDPAAKERLYKMVDAVGEYRRKVA